MLLHSNLFFFYIMSPFWSFDPFILKTNFFMLLSILVLLVPLFLFKPNKAKILLDFVLIKVKELFPKPDFINWGIMGFLLMFFVLMALINLFSLFSYVFTPTAHIMVSISLSLTLWLVSVCYQVTFYFNNKLIHFVPKGTPGWLLILMVAIEISSLLIRPITLGVRLAANLTAGHLILSLISSLSMAVSILCQLPLVLLEMVVAMVQPFVFSLLVFLYFLES